MTNVRAQPLNFKLERRWKLVHYLHLNAAVVVRGLMFPLLTGSDVLVIFI